MGDNEELKELLEYAVGYGKNKETKPDVAKFYRLTALTTPAKILELLSELKDFQWGALVEAQAGDKARREVAKLKAELECARGDIRTAQGIIEVLQKDADRYRWLRGGCNAEDIESTDGTPYVGSNGEGAFNYCGERLDLLVDTDMKKAAK